MVKNTEALFRAVNSTFRQEGLSALLRRSFVFLVDRVFWYRRYHVFERDANREQGLDEKDFLPEVDGFEFRVVSDAVEARALAVDIVNPVFHGFSAEDALQKGAIACFTLRGNEPGYVMWVAPNEKARDCIGVMPQRVDFSRGEYLASGWTNPKYRRMGLDRYTSRKAVLALSGRGLTRLRYTVNHSNRPALLATNRAGASLCAEARHLKVLWWRFWKERPLDSGEANSKPKC